MSAGTDTTSSSAPPLPQQHDNTTRRRSSIFDRFRKTHDTKVDALAGNFDTASTQTANSTNTNTSRFPLLSGRRSSTPKVPKEKKESISDRGAF